MILADDQELSRENLRDVLAVADDIRVVGEADNGRDSVRLARELEPDVVTMDVVMPELNGIEATRRIVAEMPGVKVVGVSIHEDRRYVEAMVEAGASGYVLKENVGEELVGEVRRVAGGGRPFGEGVGRRRR